MSTLSNHAADRQKGGSPRGVVRLLYLAIAGSCALLLFAMMALTVGDVLGRYLFNAPIRGAAEVTELMLAGVIFLGLPAATLDSEHVAVDLLTGYFPDWFKRLQIPFVLIVSAVVQSVIAWRLWVVAMQVGSYGGTTSSLEIPIAPVGYCAAVLCGLSALIMIAQIIYHPNKEA